MNRIEIAIEAVKKAGEVVKEGFYADEQDAHTKSHANDIVTKYDLAAQEIIVENIKNYFPNDPIIGEESGFNKTDSSTAWVIDPIDGTNPFSRKMTNFAIVVGYMVDFKAEFCIMFNPITDELAIAENEKGVTVNGEKMTIAQRPFENQLISIEGFGIQKQLYLRFILAQSIYNAIGRSAGSDSTFMVCKGQSDAYMSFTENIWDRIHCIFLQESGAKLTNLNGGEYTLDQLGYFASHPIYHDKYLSLIQSAIKKANEDLSEK